MIQKTLKYIKNKYYKNSLNTQFKIISGIFILIIFIIIMIINYVNIIDTNKIFFRYTGNILLKEITKKINTKINLVENTINLMIKDPRILDYSHYEQDEIENYLSSCVYLNNYNVFDYEVKKYSSFIDDIIYITSEYKSNFKKKNIYIASRINFSTSDAEKNIDNNLLKKAKKYKDVAVWSNLLHNKSNMNNFKLDSNVSSLYHFMAVRCIEYPDINDIGYLAVSINLDKFSETIQNIEFGESGSFYIINKSGEILVNQDSISKSEKINFNENTKNDVLGNFSNKGFYDGFIDGNNHFIFHSPLAIDNLKLVITIPVKEFSDPAKSILNSMTIVGIIALVLVISISALISNNLLKPLKEFLTIIKRTHKGIFENDINIKGCLEVKELSKDFNFMITKIKNFKKDIEDKQKKIRVAELKALRAQINPHFLYNTLGAINELALSGNGKTASKAVLALKDFFNIGLSGGIEEISIFEEIKLIQNYMDIYEIRNPGKISFFIDDDFEVKGCKTPKLILQPIVENAIKHGLDKKNGKGKIQIFVKKTDDKTIKFNVNDNGIGITDEKLKILNSHSIENSKEIKSYGIKNINQRIKLSYGEEYGIKFQSKYGKGTKVCITIPYLEKKNIKE